MGGFNSDLILKTYNVGCCLGSAARDFLPDREEVQRTFLEASFTKMASSGADVIHQQHVF